MARRDCRWQWEEREAAIGAREKPQWPQMLLIAAKQQPHCAVWPSGGAGEVATLARAVSLVASVD